MKGRAIGKGNALPGDQRLHPPDQRVARLEALEFGLAEQDARSVREGLGRILHRLDCFRLPPELHMETPEIGDRVHLRRSRQGSGALVG